MMYYELLCILPGTLSEDEAAPIIENVKKIVSDAGAANLHLESMGKNRLAYPIQHIRYGYFYILRFEAESKRVDEIQKKLVLVTSLLRSLIQKYDPETQKNARIRSFVAAEGVVIPEGYGRTERTFGAGRPGAGRQTSVRFGGQADRPAAPSTPSMPELEAVPVAKAPKEVKPKEQVSLEDIDKQLDKILETEIDV